MDAFMSKEGLIDALIAKLDLLNGRESEVKIRSRKVTSARKCVWYQKIYSSQRGS